ncbi:MAG: hypothetical protein VX527_04645 [Planctomycetota bacterium]|nr:hypothetical protein [Planctomycetota bacterium]
MRKDTYLNVVLTVIAVLLTVDVWTRIAEQPLPSDIAMAQSRSQPNRKAPRKDIAQKGVSSIGTEAIDQRARMIALLGEIGEQVGGLRGLLEGGGIKVQVSETADSSRSKATNRR